MKQDIFGTRVIDRRAFLRSSLLVTAGGLLVACSKQASPEGLSVFAGGSDYLSEVAQPFTFGLLDPAGQPLEGDAGRVRVAFVPPAGKGSRFEADASWQPFRTASLRDVSGTDPRGYFLTTMTSMPAGLIDVHVETPRGRGMTTVQVTEDPVAPVRGDIPPALVTPTTDRPRGVEDVCTRKPACGLHEMTLESAVNREGPTVVLIGSPLLCSSRMCGPVLEELLSVTEARTEANYLHLEPYASRSTIDLTEVMKRWNLPSEPWLFVLQDGVVRERFEGPVRAAAMVAAIDAASA
ncbi:MAG: hypothetical protein ACLGH3_08250 [Actinomycetota bacterium]